MGLTLDVSGLKKSYGNTAVLDGCTYRFESGSIYAVMGQNGAGKSTFFRLCTFLEQADSGTVSYIDDGIELNYDIALRRRLTLVLPSVGVFNTTVYENIAYGLKLRNTAKSEIEKKVIDAAEMVGLGDKLRRPAVTLSSGETQRMGLARAMVIRPSILFLDEPTAAVDAENSRTIEGIIQHIGNSLKATIILSTHDIDLAARTARTILTLKHGSLIDNDRRNEIY